MKQYVYALQSATVPILWMDRYVNVTMYSITFHFLLYLFTRMVYNVIINMARPYT